MNPLQDTILLVELALQDPVPKMAKFVFLYARPGNRVLLYPDGDIVVCPTPLDVRLQGYRRCKPAVLFSKAVKLAAYLQASIRLLRGPFCRFL